MVFKSNYLFIICAGLLFKLLFSAEIVYCQTDDHLLVSNSNKKEQTPASFAVNSLAGGVSNFTGNTPVAIPLYEIKLKGLTLPIALQYNNSGIKVNSEASFVGLGWSLNAGGQIARSRMGEPDDIWQNNRPNNMSYGFLLDHGQSVTDFTESGYTSDEIMRQLATISGSLIRRSAHSWTAPDPNTETGRRSDTQPDLFTFQFGNHTGKFVFGADQKVKTLQYEPLLFDYVLDNSGNPIWMGNNGPRTSKGLTSFIVKDESGNKYTFSVLETTQYYSQGGRIRTNCDIDRDWPLFNSYIPYTSAWYLTQIETAIGELVTFTYVDEALSSFSLTMNERGGNFTNTSYESDIYGSSEDNSYVAAKRISSIETPYETVTFVPGFSRDDLKNSFSLSDIQVVSKWDNLLVKQIHFSYSYFESNVNEYIRSSRANVGNAYRRLKLTSINTTAPGELNAGKYDFAYDETYALPGKGSYQQDFWGYYNGSGATHFYPKIYVNTSAYGPDRFSVLQLFPLNTPKYYVMDGANRNCDSARAMVGTLNKITYPTGGYVAYEYEPHDFIYKGIKFIGGGLRVKKITEYDGISHATDMVRNYKYYQSTDSSKSSGILFDLPIFAYLENNCAFDARGSDAYWQVPPAVARDSYDYFHYNMVRLEAPTSIKGIGDDICVGYSEVKEVLGNLGATWQSFNISVPYGEDYGEYYSTNEIKNVLSGNILYNSPNQGADFVGLDLSRNSYPFISNSNHDWNRGLLQSKKILDASGNLKMQTQYTYNVFSPETGVYPVDGVFYQTGNNYNIKNTSSQNTATYWTQALIYYNKYRIYTHINKQLSSELKTEYLNGNVVTTTTNYSFNKRKFLGSTTVTDSRGDINKTTYRYPFDFQIQPSAGVGAYNSLSYLVQDNNISNPVETVSSTTSGGVEKITSAKVTGYFEAFNKVVPNYEANLEVAAPIFKTDYNHAEIEWDEGREVVLLDPKVIGKIGYTKYDEKANCTEFVRGRIYGALIWGYNKKYAIATVVNSQYGDVFHENFEEYALGGLSMINDSRTGRYSKSSGFTKALTGLTNGYYMLTYWKKTNGIWTQVILDDVNVTANNYTINISSGIQVDDVCFYPKNAQMTTSTYLPLVGLSSTTDASGRTVYYEYDEFSRLKNIRDSEGKLVKHYKYHYKP